MPELETPKGTNKLLPITALFGKSAEDNEARLTTIIDIKGHGDIYGTSFTHTGSKHLSNDQISLKIKFQDALKIVTEAHQEGTYVDLTDERLERDNLLIKEQPKPAARAGLGGGGIIL